MATYDINQDFGRPNWHLTVKERVNQRRMDEEFADIEILAWDRNQYLAHKFILYGQSALIDRHIDGAKSRYEVLKLDLRKHSLTEIGIAMSFFYTSQLQSNWGEDLFPDRVIEVYRLAVKLEAPGLMIAVRDSFLATVENDMCNLAAAAQAIYRGDWDGDEDVQPLRDIVVTRIGMNLTRLRAETDLVANMSQYGALGKDVALALHDRMEKMSKGTTGS